MVVKKKKFNLVFLACLILIIIVFAIAIYFYNATGHAVDNLSDVSEFSLGASCSALGSVACCSGCNCSDGQGCACNCAVVENKLIWTGLCCEGKCSNGACKNPECASNIPLGYSCQNNYERYAEDSNLDGCADTISTRLCKSVCVEGKCENDEYIPSCYFMNPVNANLYPLQCMDEGRGQWSMRCNHNSYSGILCSKGCDKETGYCK